MSNNRHKALHSALASVLLHTLCCPLPLESDAACRAIPLPSACWREWFPASLALLEAARFALSILRHEYGVERLHLLREVSANLPILLELAGLVAGKAHATVIVGTFSHRLAF